MQRRFADEKRRVAVSLVWQGHMLDFLSRRAEAVAAYTQALKVRDQAMQVHPQYDLRYAQAPTLQKESESRLLQEITNWMTNALCR